MTCRKSTCDLQVASLVIVPRPNAWAMDRGGFDLDAGHALAALRRRALSSEVKLSSEVQLD